MKQTPDIRERTISGLLDGVGDTDATQHAAAYRKVAENYKELL